MAWPAGVWSAVTICGVPLTLPSGFMATRRVTFMPELKSLGSRFQQVLIRATSPSIAVWLRRAEVPVVSPRVGEPPCPVVPPVVGALLMIEAMSSARSESSWVGPG